MAKQHGWPEGPTRKPHADMRRLPKPGSVGVAHGHRVDARVHDLVGVEGAGVAIPTKEVASDPVPAKEKKTCTRTSLP